MMKRQGGSVPYLSSPAVPVGLGQLSDLDSQCHRANLEQQIANMSDFNTDSILLTQYSTVHDKICILCVSISSTTLDLVCSHDVCCRN